VQLIDAHAHLAAPDFAGDLPAVLTRAAAAGIRHIVAVGETLTDAERILALASEHALIRPAAGLYPTIMDRDAATEMRAFIRNNAESLVAIGEVGLDHWAVEEQDWPLQEEILAGFVTLANELDLVLNVHSRSAGRATIELLKAHDARRVLLHAFDGKASTALEGIEAGFFFSIPPSVVRSPQKQKLVRRLPLDRLLIEADAPVLGPRPDERNEPANARLACEAIAALKGCSPAQVAEVTTANALRLFPRL